MSRLTYKGIDVKIKYHLDFHDDTIVGIQIGPCRIVIHKELLPGFIIWFRVYMTEPRTRKLEN